MDEKVSKELKDIKKMLNNWEKFYLSLGRKGEDNDHLIEDFIEQLTIHKVESYINRFKVLDYITDKEFDEIIEYFSDRVVSFIDKVKNEDFPEKVEEEINVSSLYGQFLVHKGLVDIHLSFKDKGIYSNLVDEQKIKGYDIAVKLLPYLIKKIRQC